MPAKTLALAPAALARRKPARRPRSAFLVRSLPLPPPKGTLADLRADLAAGKFAPGVDWAAIKRAVDGRRRSRHLRPA